MTPVLLIALALASSVNDRSPGYSGGPLSAAACFPDDIFLGFGDGATASCGDEPYYEGYNSAGQFEMWSLDCDGIATACAWVLVVDGTDDVVFSGDGTFTGDVGAVGGNFSGDIGAVNATFTADIGAVNGSFSADIDAVNADLSGLATATGGVTVDADNTPICVGASGTGDLCIDMDGTDGQIDCPTCGVVTANVPLATDGLIYPAGGGAFGCVLGDESIPSTLAAGVEQSVEFCWAGKPAFKMQIEPDGAGDLQNSSFHFYGAEGEGLYWNETHTTAAKTSAGGSGATLTLVGTSTLTWLLDATTEYIYFDSEMHSDWDGASDVVVMAMVAIDTIETASDVIEAEIICEYHSEHDDIDTSTKTQTRSVNHSIGAVTAQGSAHMLTFILDWDLGGNVIEATDMLHCRFRLDAQTNINSVWYMASTVKYRTAHPAIEIVGAFPTEG